MERHIFVFNPETDFARADRSANFTPNAKIRSMRKRMALIQHPLAVAGDMFLLLDNQTHRDIISTEGYNEIMALGCGTIVPEQLAYMDLDNTRIIPWGWDMTLYRRLEKWGVPPSAMPPENRVESLTTLSHRRTTAAFISLLPELNGMIADPPQECHSVGEVEEFLSCHQPAFLKAPWSSSGRGIFTTTESTTESALQWARGIIRRQGSVMAEPAYTKTIDFATEWICREGMVSFAGYSVFHTSGRAVYKGNVEASQWELTQIIQRHINTDIRDITEAQREVIEKLIAPAYSGPLGIDMLADDKKIAAPCIELNLRTTMGHMQIWKNNRNPGVIY